jgi:eukaryotic-like serine/threonine-protein kinase
MRILRDETIEHLRGLMQAPHHERYLPLEPLGAGGMGVVYRARDQELARDVAIKVLASPHPHPEECARLVSEARVLAALEHPGIVPVHDVGTLEDGRPFYVMKCVQGAPLDIYARAGLAQAEVLRVFRQVCDAVGFAHAAGIIHRDLKPGNVMIGTFGEVLVVDWGVAKVERPHSGRSETTIWSAELDTSPGVVMGTPAYMAPEQRTGDGVGVDARTDVFGLGGILHFLLTGTHPSDAESAERWRSVPKALRAIAQRARSLDPRERYPSAAALADDLSAFSEHRPVTAYRESAIERLGRVARRHETAILLMIGYLLMRVTLLAIRR